MRTFRNPQASDVIIALDSGAVVIAPGEQAEVDFPAAQPCPDLLEEVGAPVGQPETQIEAAPEVVEDTLAAPESSPPEEAT